ncbi:hypothetical protein [Sulfurimonas sp.]|uniref:hypothetical protein n=1 Tax=Sulfurimonas sp. TaxID=2022749 RepID=UPI003D0C6382
MNIELLVTLCGFSLLNILSLAYYSGKISNRLDTAEKNIEILYEHHSSSQEKTAILHELKGQLELLISLYMPKS